MSESWITVTTTLPQSLGTEQQCDDTNSLPEIRTQRLVIRPLVQADLISFHRLRSQPAFMKHTTNGIPDADISVTQTKLLSLINASASPGAFPFPTYFGIFLKATGELIGDGGVHLASSPTCGWPELGCKFGSEHCGRGYGTEFLRAFTAWWWALPRGEGGEAVPVRIRARRDSVVWDRNGRAGCESGQRVGGGVEPDDDDDGVATEMLYAWIVPENYASQRMVIKTGFEHFVTWEHPIKKIPVLGWRQSRHRSSIYPSKL